MIFCDDRTPRKPGTRRHKMQRTSPSQAREESSKPEALECTPVQDFPTSATRPAISPGVRRFPPLHAGSRLMPFAATLFAERMITVLGRKGWRANRLCASTFAFTPVVIVLSSRPLRLISFNRMKVSHSERFAPAPVPLQWLLNIREDRGTRRSDRRRPRRPRPQPRKSSCCAIKKYVRRAVSASYRLLRLLSSSVPLSSFPSNLMSSFPVPPILTSFTTQ
jgi:hypothetical protein